MADIEIKGKRFVSRIPNLRGIGLYGDIPAHPILTLARSPVFSRFAHSSSHLSVGPASV